jgi:chaperonin GroEL
MNFSTPDMTIAKEIEFEDAYENIGAQIVKEIVSKTSDSIGDGVTMATIITEVIVRKGLKNVSSAVNPIMLKRSIDNAVEAIVAELARTSKTIEISEEIH